MLRNRKGNTYKYKEYWVIMTKVWATIVLTLVLMLSLVVLPAMANQIQRPQLLNSTMTIIPKDPFVTYNGFLLIRGLSTITTR
ncbi:hypothetical protein B7L70_04925 [Vulcanisaeta sp. EB80]|nr:hypothetical protein B7L70_04925 [Vulcanisaeta sp. EB80]